MVIHCSLTLIKDVEECMGFGYDFQGDFVHTQQTDNTGKQEE